MTVAELHAACARLVAEGHGQKDVGFPEGFHSSGSGPHESVVLSVEENTDGDSLPGFVWIEIRKEDT